MSQRKAYECEQLGKYISAAYRCKLVLLLLAAPQLNIYIGEPLRVSGGL